MGYKPQTIHVNNQSTIDVTMSEDNTSLEEVVVVGYGVQKRRDIVGAVETLSTKGLEERMGSSMSISRSLQGAIPGLTMTFSDGKPNRGATVRIRGAENSIGSGGSALVMVDGVETDMSTVNPDDIESITVLKDASSAAIYGARGAFGVILITTKSGKYNEKAEVSYNGYFSVSSPTTSTDYENRGYWSVYTVNKFWQADSGTNYVKYNDHDMQQLLARVNDRTEHPDRPWVVEEIRNGRKQWVYYGNYDWWDMLFQQRRPVQQHNISLSGGTKDIKYLVSGAYDRQEGIQRAHPDVYNKYLSLIHI